MENQFHTCFQTCRINQGNLKRKNHIIELNNEIDKKTRIDEPTIA